MLLLLAEITKPVGSVPALKTKSRRNAPVASLMADYWVAFVKSGDPNGGGRPRWQTFDSGSVMHFADDADAGEMAGAERLKVFDGVYETLRAPRVK